MATVTPGYTWVSGETVTVTKMNSAAAPTISNIVNADIGSGAAIALSKLATGALPTGITVASANLVSSTQQSLVPAGAIMAFAMNSAPSGWLAADGAEYSKAGTYAALFAAIGTTHGETNGSGGAGTSHFRVPDLRGIFVRGSGSQTISGTTYSGTFAAKQQDDLKSHQHTFTDSIWEAGSAQPIFGAINGVRSTSSLTTTGGPTGTETRPANIALLYCIKF